MGFRRRATWLVAGSAVLAFWIVLWGQTADSVLTRVPVLDEAYYLRAAAAIADPAAELGPAVMSPLYPLLVAVTGGARPVAGGVIESHPWLLLALQALAWVGVGLLVRRVVMRAGAGRAGVPAGGVALAAALLFWLYRPAAIYGRTVLLEVPLALAVTAYLAGLSTWIDRREPPPWWQAAASGLVLGLAALLRAHTLVLLLPAVWLAGRRLRAGTARSRWLTLGAALIASALVPVVAASAYNTRQVGHLAGPSLNGGINLYLGQASGAWGLFATLPGLDLEADPSGRTYLAIATGETVPDAGAADRRWYAEVARLAGEHPGRIPLLWLRKVWLHLQGWEIAQITPLAAWTAEAPVLTALWVPWALLAALGITGAVVAVRRRPAPPAAAASGVRLRALAWVWASSLLLLVAVQSLFFVVSRYRLVLVPLLAVLAGLGALRLWPRLQAATGRADRWRRARGPAAVLLAVLVVTIPWGLGETRRHWRVLELENQALRLERLAAVRPGRAAGAWREAATLYRRSLALESARPQPYRGLARVLSARGDADEAVAVLAEGLRMAEPPGDVQRDLIERLLTAGREDDAHAQLVAYLRDHPDDADMLHNLAVLLGRRGHWRDVEVTARRLRAAAPDDPRGFVDLAAALVRQGRREAAVATLQEGLQRLPGQPDLTENLRRLESPR